MKSIIGFFYLLIISTKTTRADQCTADKTQVPRKVNFKSGPSDYTLLESALQIYTHIRIPCDGWLERWKFMVEPGHVISGLHLGVFRPRDPGVFELVGRSHFVIMPTPPNVTWISHEVKQKIMVRRGDCLGIFYDKFETQSKQLTIRSRLIPESYVTQHFPTYVLAMDEESLALNRTIDVRTAMKEFRSPALSAYISGNQLSQKPSARSNRNKQWSITAPKEYLQTVEMALLQKALGAHAAAQSQDPPPLVPLKPHSASDIFAFNQCDRPSKVPFDFVKQPVDRYEFAETSLQIFTSMTIECDGFLSGWHFLATNEVIDGVHLAVFRRRHPVDEPHMLTLVDKTRIGHMKPPARGARGFWVTYLPEHPISVKAGDYIGIYYDDYKIPSEMAAILSRTDESNESLKSSPTFVLLMDGHSLNTNDQIDIRNAAETYRLPALSATVEPIGYVRQKQF